MVRAKRGVRGNNNPDRPINPRKLFDDHHVFGIAHARTAVFGGEDSTHQPQLANFLDRGQRKLTGFVPFHNVGSDLALSELAHGFLQLQLLFVQLEIQQPSDCCGPTYSSRL